MPISDINLDIKKPPQLADIIYRELHEAIVTGQMEPGTSLVQNDLAQQLGVSRTPVRDALERLVREGLITRSPTGQTYVAEMSLAEVIEKYQVRRALEGLAVRLAMPRLTESDLETIKSLLQQTEQAVAAKDAPSVVRLGNEIHAVIIDKCGNELLRELLGNLGVSIRRYRLSISHIPVRLQESFEEHVRVYEAIVKRDVEAAVLAMEQHIMGSERDVQKAVNPTSAKEDH